MAGDIDTFGESRSTKLAVARDTPLADTAGPILAGVSPDGEWFGFGQVTDLPG